MSDPAEERKFLHDLATPLSVALGMLESGLGQVERNEPLNPENIKKLIDRLNKAKNAVIKSAELLKARRQVLIEEQQKRS